MKWMLFTVITVLVSCTSNSVNQITTNLVIREGMTASQVQAAFGRKPQAVFNEGSYKVWHYCNIPYGYESVPYQYNVVYLENETVIAYTTYQVSFAARNYNTDNCEKYFKLGSYQPLSNLTNSD